MGIEIQDHNKIEREKGRLIREIRLYLQRVVCAGMDELISDELLQLLEDVFEIDVNDYGKTFIRGFLYKVEELAQLLDFLEEIHFAKS